MADRAGNFGLDRELEAKRNAKYDPQLEDQARRFVEQRTGAQIPAGRNCLAALKDGVLLCQMINSIRPGAVKKINNGKMPFHKMENIGNYLAACEKIGIRKSELFQTVDLFEEQNMNAVVLNIMCVARESGQQISTKPGGAVINPYESAPAYSAPTSAPPKPTAAPPAAPNQQGKWKASSELPLLQAGAAQAGKTAGAGWGSGRRDITTNAGASANVVPLLQQGAADAGKSAGAGFGVGRRDITSNAGGSSNNVVPLLQAGAAQAGKNAGAGWGSGRRDITTNAGSSANVVPLLQQGAMDAGRKAHDALTKGSMHSIDRTQGVHYGGAQAAPPAHAPPTPPAAAGPARFCGGCGTAFANGTAKFCSNCGAPR